MKKLFLAAAALAVSALCAEDVRPVWELNLNEGDLKAIKSTGTAPAKITLNKAELLTWGEGRTGTKALYFGNKVECKPPVCSVQIERDDKVIDFINGENKRILILDGIMDPHNFGAIIRSVDAFGYDAIVLPNNRSVRITETVAHVSTGAIEHVKIAYVNSLSTFIKRLKENDYWICGTDASGNTLINQIDKNRNLAVIIGSEGFGMSKTLVNMSDYLITIPMVGHVNSLNASVSAGIVLHGLGKK
jgi:predicted rRNA methylase